MLLSPVSFMEINVDDLISIKTQVIKNY